MLPSVLADHLNALWINPLVDRKEAKGRGMPGEGMGRVRRKLNHASVDVLSSN